LDEKSEFPTLAALSQDYLGQTATYAPPEKFFLITGTVIFMLQDEIYWVQIFW